MVELACHFPEFIENQGILRPGRNLKAERQGINMKIGPLDRDQCNLSNPATAEGYPNYSSGKSIAV